MKRFISILFIFGITFIFQQQLDGGFAFRNGTETDVLVMINGEWAIFSCSDGERWKTPADELRAFLGQLWTQSGPPAELWKIERIPLELDQDEPEEKEIPKSGEPLT